MNQFLVTRTGTGAIFGSIHIDPLRPDPGTGAILRPANARSMRESGKLEAQLIDAALWLAETEDNVVSVCLDCGLTVSKDATTATDAEPGT